MSEHDEPSSDQAAPPSDGTEATIHRSRTTGLWWKILLFAGGVLVGVLGVGLLNATTPDFATAAVGPAPAGSSSQPGASVPAGVGARVNAACLGVINDAQDVYAVLSDLGPALDDVDLTALDDIVRRLQPIEPRLGRDLTACRVDTTVTSGEPGPGASPSSTAGPLPSPQPSATR